MAVPYRPRAPSSDASQSLTVAALSLSSSTDQHTIPKIHAYGHPHNASVGGSSTEEGSTDEGSTAGGSTEEGNTEEGNTEEGSTSEATIEETPDIPSTLGTKSPPPRPRAILPLDPATLQMIRSRPDSSPSKSLGKYSLRIAFLSSTIRDFTAVRDKLLELSPRIKSKAMDTIINKLQPLIETPVKSDLIDFMWENKMRLSSILSSLLKHLEKLDKKTHTRRWKDHKEYRKEERHKADPRLRKHKEDIKQILRPYITKKSK